MKTISITFAVVIAFTVAILVKGADPQGVLPAKPTLPIDPNKDPSVPARIKALYPEESKPPAVPKTTVKAPHAPPMPAKHAGILAEETQGILDAGISEVDHSYTTTNDLEERRKRRADNPLPAATPEESDTRSARSGEHYPAPTNATVDAYRAVLVPPNPLTGTPENARRYGRPSLPRLDWLVITNGVIWPVPTGAAVMDISGPTALRLAPFPEGADMLLAIRNPDGHPVFIDFPTNAFLVLDPASNPLTGRYLVHVRQIRGETWISK